MRKLKFRKLIIVIAALALILNFPGNVLAYSNATSTQQLLTDKKWTNTLYKLSNSPKLSDSSKVVRRYATTNYEISSYDALKSEIAYILQNRITDVNLHITYSYGDDVNTLQSQIDALLNNPPVDDYTSTSVTSWDRSGSGYDGDFNISLKYTYVETKDQANYVETQVQQILSQIIKPGMSDLEKEKAIHDYIILNTAYDETSPDTDIKYSDYNAITKHIAVCEGYALLCYKMLTDAGIEARIVVSDNPPDEEGHAWNMAKIGGNWYQLDCTFDDPVPDVKGRVEYNYFNKTDSEIAADGDHHWDGTKYPAATTKFDASAFEKPSIDSVTLKNAAIDVETSNIKDNTSINFSLVHEDGSDASKSNGEDSLLMLDDDSQLIVSDDGYAGYYIIPEYVPEGNYKIKVSIGDQTAYSNVISVKRDSVITVNNLTDGYSGNNFPGTLTGSASDKDGISYLTVDLEDANDNYIDLTTGETTDSGVKTIKPNSDGTFSEDIPAFNKIKDGKYTITLMAFDSNGIETSKAINFTKDSSASTYDWQKVLNSKPWETKYSSATELSTLMDVAPSKKFTVKFSSDFDFTTLNSSNVQIVDAENGQVVASTVTKIDSTTAQVVPTSNLTAGRVYYVVVNNNTIKSASGKNLKNVVVCPVKVASN
ncbi:transglutaminase domain-containing protein [Clostridium hydrogenum]|uniref:transglutaminase domain-containing protein n=1 Tax=Clostridium hydrogenum TaxID=2855764 RepID=UPI001F4079FA|nr:transglutaminase domain-containing protein [Clostridium hydrogenum]